MSFLALTAHHLFSFIGILVIFLGCLLFLIYHFKIKNNNSEYQLIDTIPTFAVMVVVYTLFFVYQKMGIKVPIPLLCSITGLLLTATVGMKSFLEDNIDKYNKYGQWADRLLITTAVLAIGFIFVDLQWHPWVIDLLN